MIALVGSECLTLSVLDKTMCLVEQALNARSLTIVSDSPEVLEALTLKQMLLGRPLVAKPLMPDLVTYSNCR